MDTIEYEKVLQGLWWFVGTTGASAKSEETRRTCETIQAVIRNPAHAAVWDDHGAEWFGMVASNRYRMPEKKPLLRRIGEWLISLSKSENDDQS
jgi:hypothetical protein